MKVRLCLRLLLGAVCYFLPYADCQSAVLISEQLDARGDASPGYCDIVAARIWQPDSRHYQLEVETAAPLPIFNNETDWIWFAWLLDTDRNPATGQPHDNIGSEFNVRGVVSEDPSVNCGMIDLVSSIPALGGEVTKFVSGNKITIILPFDRIAGQNNFRFQVVSESFINGVRATPDVTGIGSAVPATQPFPADNPLRVVADSYGGLREGITAFTPQVWLQGEDGRPVFLQPGDKIELYSYFNYLNILGRTVTAYPGVFHPTPLAMAVNGRLSDNRVAVNLGSIWIDPPVVHLNTVTPGKDHATLSLHAADAYGTTISLAGRNINWENFYQAPAIQVLPLSTPGLAEVQCNASAGGGLSDVKAYLDGVPSHSYAHVRITTQDYNLPPFSAYAGLYNTFFNSHDF